MAGGTHGHPLPVGRYLESFQLTMVRAMRFYTLVYKTLQPFDEGCRELEGADSFLCEEVGRKFCRQRVASD